MTSRINIVFLGFLVWLADSGFSYQNSAFSLQVGGGLSTYKSEMVASVDTSTSSGISLESNAGSQGQISAFISQVNNTTSFQFTAGGVPSGSTTSFIDSGFLFRWKWLQLGPAWSSLYAEIDREGSPHIRGTGLGQGGRVALVIPIRKGSHIFLKATQTSYSTFNEAIQELDAAALGTRSDLFIGGRVRVTKSLISFDMGYRQQTFVMSLLGTTTSEAITTTWVGLNFHWRP
ncbi:MAG: hypothetical protein AB8C84_07490 [Oligoflexales bacterium]